MITKPILLVEDDLDIQDNLRQILELEGYQVHVVSNGQEALEYLHHGNPVRVILLDLMMPVMNGYEFLGKVRGNEFSRYLKTPIILLSAAKDVTDTSKNYQLPYVKKPINLELLLKEIGTCFNEIN